MADLRETATRSATTEEGKSKKLYCAVYVFSVVYMLVGVVIYDMGDEANRGWDGIVFTALMIVEGLFILMQADLLVTYYTLKRRTVGFKEENTKFKTFLKEKKREIKKLTSLGKKFAKLDADYEGCLKKAEEDLAVLEGCAKDRIQQGASALLIMYAADREHTVPAEELDKALHTLGLPYRRMYPDYNERIVAMKEAIRASARFQREKALEPDRLGKLFKEALHADEVEGIPEKVHVLMLEKGRATLMREYMDNQTDVVRHSTDVLEKGRATLTREHVDCLRNG